MTSLVALHGYTQNGASIRAALAPIQARLPELTLICPDGPHTCSPDSVARLHANGREPPPPHRSWWDASDDGRVYRGWDSTREQLGNALATSGATGVLGFSQGAMLASIVAALCARGELATIRFVILIAGRAPRADVMQPFFAQPITLPSLHVWGQRDHFTAPASEALVQRFDPATREVAVWPGAHVIPARGTAADAIVDFIHRHG